MYVINPRKYENYLKKREELDEEEEKERNFIQNKKIKQFSNEKEIRNLKNNSILVTTATPTAIPSTSIMTSSLEKNEINNKEGYLTIRNWNQMFSSFDTPSNDFSLPSELEDEGEEEEEEEETVEKEKEEKEQRGEEESIKINHKGEKNQSSSFIFESSSSFNDSNQNNNKFEESIEIINLSQLFQDVENFDDLFLIGPIPSSTSSLSIHSFCDTPIKSPTQQLETNPSLSCNIDLFPSTLNNNGSNNKFETIEKTSSMWSFLLPGSNLNSTNQSFIEPSTSSSHFNSNLSLIEETNDMLPLKKRFKRKKTGLLM